MKQRSIRWDLIADCDRRLAYDPLKRAANSAACLNAGQSLSQCFVTVSKRDPFATISCHRAILTAAANSLEVCIWSSPPLLRNALGGLPNWLLNGLAIADASMNPLPLATTAIGNSGRLNNRRRAVFSRCCFIYLATPWSGKARYICERDVPTIRHNASTPKSALLLCFSIAISALLRKASRRARLPRTFADCASPPSRRLGRSVDARLPALPYWARRSGPWHEANLTASQPRDRSVYCNVRASWLSASGHRPGED